MDDIVFDLNSFIKKCTALLPEYINSLNNNFNSIHNASISKKVILSFLKEYIEHNKSKFLRNQFNVNFIPKFLFEIIREKYPELSQLSSTSLNAVLNHFFNFLALNKVLQGKIHRLLVDKSNDMLEKEQAFKNRLNENELIEIKNFIINSAKNLDEIYDDEEKYNQVYDFIKNKPPNLLIQAIFDIFRTAEDLLFFKILPFIDEFIKIKTLPSLVIKSLKKSPEQDEFFYRLLILYNTFFLAGYNLKVQLSDLLADLNVDERSLFTKMVNYYQEGAISLDSIDLPYSDSNNDILLDFNHYINEIMPISAEMPFADMNTYRLFNLPKNIELNLSTHVHFLESLLKSERRKIMFLHSEWDDKEDFTSGTKEPPILINAKELFNTDNLNDALKLVNLYLKRNPDSAAGYYLKGKILGEQEKYHNALLCLLESIKSDPHRIETYMDIVHVLEIGGYFYSSFVLASMLLKFCPFDFNLLLILAISSNQLCLPFLNILEAAGLIDSGRLINFLTRYWIHERIKPRDSIKSLQIEQELLSELQLSTRLISLNTIQLLTGFKRYSNTEAYLNQLNNKLNNSLYFFPNKQDHLLKNWMIYDLTVRLVRCFTEFFYINLPYIIGSEDFINLCFEMAKITISNLLKLTKSRTHKNRTTTSIDIDTEIILKNETIIKHPLYNLACFFISVESISTILLSTTVNLINECKTCPNKCMEKPFKWCEAFYLLGMNDEDLIDDGDTIHFISSLSSDFEMSLEDKGMNEKTILKKTTHVDHFLSFMINKGKFSNDTDIWDQFEDQLTPKCLILFLGSYAIKNDIIYNLTSLKELCQSIKTFLVFLKREFDSISKSSYTELTEILKNHEFFMLLLKEYQNSSKINDEEIILKDYHSKFNSTQ